MYMYDTKGQQIGHYVGLVPQEMLENQIVKALAL